MHPLYHLAKHDNYPCGRPFEPLDRSTAKGPKPGEMREKKERIGRPLILFQFRVLLSIFPRFLRATAMRIGPNAWTAICATARQLAKIIVKGIIAELAFKYGAGQWLSMMPGLGTGQHLPQDG